MGPIIFLVVMIAGFSIAAPKYFPTAENLVTILNDGALLAILACGLTLVLIAGEFDVSIASIASFAGAEATVLVTKLNWAIAPTILVVILTALVCGLINGALITGLRIHALIATIGTASLLDGGTLWITGNSVIFSGFTDELIWCGSWRLFGLQAPVYSLIVIAAITAFMLRYTTTGRHLYAIGGNRG